MGITAPQMQSLVSKSAVNLGTLELQQAFTTQFGTTLTNPENQVDTATAAFLQIKAADFASAALGPSIGSCLVTNSTNGVLPWTAFPATRLDAGPGIAIAGGSGSATVQFQNNSLNGATAFSSELVPSGMIPFQNTAGAYTGGIDSSPSDRFIPAGGGGQFTFSNGNSGAAGQFQASLTVPTTPFNWSQRTALNQQTVNRAKGLTVTWSNGDPNSYVQISGRSMGSLGSTGVVEFTCSAPASAGQFTIPSTVFASMPAASLTQNIADPAYVPILQVAQLSLPQSFSVPNLDFASIQFIASYSIMVSYQ
jgi:hypothetical protein